MSPPASRPVPSRAELPHHSPHAPVPETPHARTAFRAHPRPRPTKSTVRPGRFTLDTGTALHIGAGAEPAADLLRTLLAPATGLPLPASPRGS